MAAYTWLCRHDQENRCLRTKDHRVQKDHRHINETRMLRKNRKHSKTLKIRAPNASNIHSFVV